MTGRQRYSAAEVELLEQLDPDVRPISFSLSLYGEKSAAAAAILALSRDGYVEVLGIDGTPLRRWELEQALRDDAAWSDPQLRLRLTDSGAAWIS